MYKLILYLYKNGGDGPLSAGAGYSEGEQHTNSFGSKESSHNKVSLDTTALKIRDAIENGFDSGVNDIHPMY